MALTKQWICFLVNQNFLRRRNQSVEKEIRRVFGKDFIAFRMTAEGAEEVYAFVRCREYFKYVDKIRQSSAIKSVLATNENPYFLSNFEVSEFVESAKPVKIVCQFQPGDIVRVKDGCYSNLTGLIVESISSRTCLVMFSFHIRRFCEKIHTQDLEKVASVLHVVKRFPVRRHAYRREKTR